MPKGNNGAQHGGPAACLGKSCEWENGGSGLQCVDGGGGCGQALFLEAEESIFHDKNLAAATKKLNRILSRVPAGPKGLKLSFCETSGGTLLAWVKHTGGKAGKRRVVTRRDDDATIAKSLKLKAKAAKAK